MPLDRIEIRGARQHNLKNVDLTLPARPAGGHHRPVRQRQVVACLRHDLRRGAAPLRRVAVVVRAPVPGPDGQARRRVHLGPVTGDLDRPEGRQPQPALDGRHGHRDLRLPAPAVRPRRAAALPELSVGRSSSRRPSRSSTPSSTCPRARGIMVLAPLVEGRKGEYQSVFDDVRKAGFVRVRVDGEVRDLSERSSWRSNQKHSIEVVVDRLVVSRDAEDKSRIADSVEQALQARQGPGHHQRAARATRRRLGRHAVLARTSPVRTTAPRCRRSSRAASRFNTPHGACPTCTGLGTRLEVDPDLVLANKDLTWPRARSRPGARPAGTATRYYRIAAGVGRAVLRLLDERARARAEAGAHRPRSCTARARSGSRSHTRARAAAVASTAPPTRVSSRTSSGASRRPTATSFATTCRSTWRPARARPVTARG